MDPARAADNIEVQNIDDDDADGFVARQRPTTALPSESFVAAHDYRSRPSVDQFAARSTGRIAVADDSAHNKQLSEVHELEDADGWKITAGVAELQEWPCGATALDTAALSDDGGSEQGYMTANETMVD